MDFYDDPNLFVGGLEGLDDDGFPSAPSLVDELNLAADFEPLRVESLGPGKHQGMMPPVSTHQAMPAYSQQMGHYIGIKAQNQMAQAFPGPGGTGGGGGDMIAEHGQFHNPAMSQVPQSNGLFCNSSSPMWDNQDQNGNMYHALSQQHHLHSQQLHVRQQLPQQHHPCHHQQEQQHRICQQQLQQQQTHQQQLLNQHQQINPQTMSLQQQQHHSYSFHSQNHQQIHISQQQVQHQLTAGGPRFHSGGLPSKSYLDSQNASLSGTCLQQQQQQQQPSGYQMTRVGQDPNLAFPMHSSSMVHSLPTCSVSAATAYPPAQYPAYPGEAEIPGLRQQPLSSASVSRPTTTTAPLTSTVPELTVCQYPSAAVMSQQHTRISVSQAEECPFQDLHCSDENQGDYKSSELFGDSMNCYQSMACQLPSEQPQSCGAINTNGYQALGDSLLPSEVHDGDLQGLEPPDLLPDLLPQLEAALNQQDKSNCSWADSRQETRHEHKKPPPVDYKEEKALWNNKTGDLPKPELIHTGYLPICKGP